MTTKIVQSTVTHNLVCHFCGLAKPSFQTVTRGHFRLCRECLLKHPIDIVVKGTEEIDEPVAKE
jgi:primosomal protein N'